MHTVAEWWMWLCFFGVILTMLAADTFLFETNKSQRTTTKSALHWTIIWVISAIIFNLLLWFYVHHTVNPQVGHQKALEFFTGYLLEKSLSIDNLFVFLTIFHYFSVPAAYQRRVLIIGIVGAMVMRLIMITLGIILVSKIHWILYVFGLFLLIIGVNMFFTLDKQHDLGKNPIVRWLTSRYRITETFQGEKFFIRRNKLLYMTPLFVVLVLIEVTDLIFAVDSIPAVFAVTEDPFIVFTSNIFAILGLRALYFLLAHTAERFHLIKYGIALILSFVGVKMLIAPWLKINNVVILSVVVSILLSCIILSWKKSVKK